MEEQVNILIVDDHQMFIDGIKALLRKEKKFKITAEALCGKDALLLLENEKFDVLVTDISMPEMTGVELTKIVKEKYPYIKVLVLTMFNDQEVIEDIIMSEAEGYILKNTGKSELVAALEALSNGSTFYSREVLTSLMQKVQKDKKIQNETINLSEREKEVLELICQEYSSDEIAGKLFISRRTVDTHRQHIYEKTGCKTIVSLIKFAIRNQLVEI
ncbi:MAG: response regulator transcription factor [Bacteroidota bacterium]